MKRCNAASDRRLHSRVKLSSRFKILICCAKLFFNFIDIVRLLRRNLFVSEFETDIVIGIDEEGRYFLEGREEELMSLHQSLREVSGQGIQIRIDTDRNAPLHRVVEIADLCQFNGLDDLVLRTYDEHYNKKR